MGGESPSHCMYARDSAVAILKKDNTWWYHVPIYIGRKPIKRL